MVQKDETREVKEGPPQADESWWEAVLDEIESYVLPNDDQEQNPSKAGLGQAGRLPPQGNVDWEQAQDLYQQDQIIHLKVSGYNQGGLLVEGMGLQGFVPISHLVGLVEECDSPERKKILAAYIGDELRLKVIECNSERGRVVFSERAAQSDSGSRIELFENLEVGMCVKGSVTTITDFGAFVDLGGVEGLIHISELSWGRVQHPSDMLTIGDSVKAYVLQLDKDRGRVALSLKRLHPNPWETVGTRYQPGQTAEAVITSVVSYGAFARLEDGLDGLIHVSEFGEPSQNVKPREVLQEGQSVQVRILHVDPANQRMGLSLITDGGE
ncbi:MAG: S1 RNA-binding domain-containing protein [Anaerolineales bacterium]